MPDSEEKGIHSFLSNATFCFGQGCHGKKSDLEKIILKIISNITSLDQSLRVMPDSEEKGIHSFLSNSAFCFPTGLPTCHGKKSDLDKIEDHISECYFVLSFSTNITSNYALTFYHGFFFFFSFLSNAAFCFLQGCHGKKSDLEKIKGHISDCYFNNQMPVFINLTR